MSDCNLQNEIAILQIANIAAILLVKSKLSLTGVTQRNAKPGSFNPRIRSRARRQR